MWGVVDVRGGMKCRGAMSARMLGLRLDVMGMVEGKGRFASAWS